jgi:hypothetical protein
MSFQAPPQSNLAPPGTQGNVMPGYLPPTGLPPPPIPPSFPGYQVPPASQKQQGKVRPSALHEMRNEQKILYVRKISCSCFLVLKWRYSSLYVKLCFAKGWWLTTFNSKDSLIDT